MSYLQDMSRDPFLAHANPYRQNRNEPTAGIVGLRRYITSPLLKDVRANPVTVSMWKTTTETPDFDALGSGFVPGSSLMECVDKLKIANPSAECAGSVTSRVIVDDFNYVYVFSVPVITPEAWSDGSRRSYFSLGTADATAIHGFTIKHGSVILPAMLASQMRQHYATSFITSEFDNNGRLARLTYAPKIAKTVVSRAQARQDGIRTGRAYCTWANHVLTARNSLIRDLYATIDEITGTPLASKYAAHDTIDSLKCTDTELYHVSRTGRRSCNREYSGGAMRCYCHDDERQQLPIHLRYYVEHSLLFKLITLASVFVKNPLRLQPAYVDFIYAVNDRPAGANPELAKITEYEQAQINLDRRWWCKAEKAAKAFCDTITVDELKSDNVKMHRTRDRKQDTDPVITDRKEFLVFEHEDRYTFPGGDNSYHRNRDAYGNPTKIPASLTRSRLRFEALRRNRIAYDRQTVVTGCA